MNIRTFFLASLLPLAACDFDPKDIGDPSGDTVESAGSSSVGYSSDGPNMTTVGSSTTGADPTVATSTTAVDTESTSTTGADPTDATTDTTTDPTVATSTTGVDPTGNESTSMGSTGTSTTTNGTTDTTGPDPDPVMCDVDPVIFPEFDKQCEAKADCVAVTRTLDCCGSVLVLGINIGALDEFNAAQALCTEEAIVCDCPPNAPIAEDGNSVLAPEDASLGCIDNLCQTFVF